MPQEKNLPRPAVQADREQVVAMLVRAFHRDPLLRFFFPGQEYEARAGFFFALLFDIRLELGRIDVIDDLSGAALWNLPTGITETPAISELWKEFAESGSEEEHNRFARFEDASASHEPPPGFWYLGVLGVEPTRARMGLGTSVLAPVLASADQEAVPAYLETGTQANVDFYEKLGFKIRSEFDVLDGPHAWGLWRSPRPRAYRLT